MMTVLHATKRTHALHALDCLVLGPRPGDFARVQAMGVEAFWLPALSSWAAVCYARI